MQYQTPPEFHLKLTHRHLDFHQPSVHSPCSLNVTNRHLDFNQPFLYLPCSFCGTEITTFLTEFGTGLSKPFKTCDHLPHDSSFEKMLRFVFEHGRHHVPLKRCPALFCVLRAYSAITYQVQGPYTRHQKHPESSPKSQNPALRSAAFRRFRLCHPLYIVLLNKLMQNNCLSLKSRCHRNRLSTEPCPASFG